MKRIIILLLCVSTGIYATAQEIIQIPHEKAKGITWEGGEKEYFSKRWQTEVVTNVSVPTMEVFRPENPNGVSVVIAPGGALYALGIKNEGTDVAKRLNQQGVTAFVLKYRLIPTGEDGVQESANDGATSFDRISARVLPVLPYSYADGLAAIKHVRENAESFKIDPKKIGFMGFSAGGAVTMGVAYNYTETNRPDFLVPVYAWTLVMPVQEVPEDAPPMFVICASDDPLGLASGSIELYSSWLKANKPVGLQMYAKGGHGFGMKKQGLPSDTWIERFHDWSVAQGINKE
jgi:acetyl esterase/lipase